MNSHNRPSITPPEPSNPPALRDQPTKLFVETTTRCNLNCFMCVKQALESAVVEGDMAFTTFTALEPAFHGLEALVLNGIGEPLLHPQMEEFIRRAKMSMPREGWIGFQSNGLLLNNHRAFSLVEAGLDRICLSIDAVSPDTFRKVREGGELDAIDRAFSALGSAKERCRRPDVQVGVEFVVMRSNLHELPAALIWAASRGASFAIVTHVLPYDEGHAEEAAYDTCTDEAVSLFHTWREKGERDGVDIYRYTESRWKYTKSPEDRKVVELVEEMKADAERRGIFIDVRKLLRIDYDRHEEIGAIFDEAREVARETGLDLRLPEVVLREKRECSFVEEGGAFISWDGNVSPCYFLWHRYHCYASGWDQRVQPKVFGNLAGRGILDIWNDKEYRSFRKGVMAYDYPHCSSCTLAPCDYVQTDSFEQDCHIRNVPCGACLWCMGVFQCLH